MIYGLSPMREGGNRGRGSGIRKTEAQSLKPETRIYPRYDVIIVGGGAVGLFLACRLAQLGLNFLVLERNPRAITHSRSIGIHPPSLEKLALLGVATDMLEQGTKVTRGRAFANTTLLGELDFSRLPGAYPFVLTLPQSQTEKILERRLFELCPGALLRGADVHRLASENEAVTVAFTSAEGQARASAHFVVGCDGKNSVVRQAAGITFPGGSYPDSYLMGDFTDSSDLGRDAAIYLTDEGLVESFPLPGDQRRWVVKTDCYEQNATVHDLATLLKKRVRADVLAETNTMLSAFGVQHYLAKRFVAGRIALAGDAAHILSPIGGQGMNLGWLDAWLLAEVFALISQGGRAEPLLARYNQRRRRAAWQAIKRAELNMLLGRKTRFAGLRNALVWTMLNTPLAGLMSRVFTMRGL